MRLAPEAADFARELSCRSSELDASSDPADLDRYCAWIAAWADRFVAEFEAEIAAVTREEGVNSLVVRRFLAARLQELTGECVTELSAVPALRSLFASPRVASMTVEQALEAVLQKLLALLPKLPAQGQAGVRKAILAIRKALIPFDSRPISIEFTDPASNLVMKYIPAIGFSMTDTGSGPDPASRKLEAANTGPVAQKTTDLTGFTQIVTADPANGKVVVAASGFDVEDGFITLRASGMDLAGNGPTIGERAFVLDRATPNVSVTAPQEGSEQPPALAVNATIQDTVSGIKLPLTVTLDGQDVLASLQVSPGPSNSLGAANTVTLTGQLSTSSGPHILVIGAQDLAGNGTQFSVPFTVGAVALPSVQLLKVGGDGQQGTVGRPAGTPLTVKAVDPTTGRAVPHTQVFFEIEEGGGHFYQLPGADTITNENGVASIRFAFGTSAGGITVRARPLGDINALSTAFQLHASVPQVSVALESDVPVQSTSAGSALPAAIRVDVTDTSGTPLPNEAVRTILEDASGAAIANPESVGAFRPPEGLTDGSGVMRFGFLASSSAPAGSYAIRIILPDSGVSVKVPIDVLAADPEPLPQGTSIAITAGQGQLGAIGQQVSHSLDAIASKGAAASMVVSYEVAAGRGFLQSPSGTVVSVDENGNPTRIDYDIAGDGQTVSAFFTMAESRSPGVVIVKATVTTGAGQTIVATRAFLVGHPEIRFVTSGLSPTGLVSMTNLFTMNGGFAPSDPSREFRIEVRGPDVGPTMASNVVSLNTVRANIPAGGLTVAPIASPITLARVSTGEQFALYRSGPIVTTNETRVVNALTEQALPPNDPRGFVHAEVGGFLVATTADGVPAQARVRGVEIVDLRRIRRDNLASFAPRSGVGRGGNKSELGTLRIQTFGPLMDDIPDMIYAIYPDERGAEIAEFLVETTETSRIFWKLSSSTQVTFTSPYDPNPDVRDKLTVSASFPGAAGTSFDLEEDTPSSLNFRKRVRSAQVVFDGTLSDAPDTIHVEFFDNFVPQVTTYDMTETAGTSLKFESVDASFAVRVVIPPAPGSTTTTVEFLDLSGASIATFDLKEVPAQTAGTRRFNSGSNAGSIDLPRARPDANLMLVRVFDPLQSANLVTVSLASPVDSKYLTLTSEGSGFFSSGPFVPRPQSVAALPPYDGLANLESIAFAPVEGQDFGMSVTHEGFSDYAQGGFNAFSGLNVNASFGHAGRIASILQDKLGWWAGWDESCTEKDLLMWIKDARLLYLYSHGGHDKGKFHAITVDDGTGVGKNPFYPKDFTKEGSGFGPNDHQFMLVFFNGCYTGEQSFNRPTGYAGVLGVTGPKRVYMGWVPEMDGGVCTSFAVRFFEGLDGDGPPTVDDVLTKIFAGGKFGNVTRQDLTVIGDQSVRLDLK